VTEILLHSKANRSEEAARMLERCVRLDAAYIPAYLLLARLYQGQEGRGPAVGRLLRHVAHLQPNSPDHLAELAAWLHQQGEGHILHICIVQCSLPHPPLPTSNLHLRFPVIVVVTK
jgi:predicted Zn-dependent protease